MKQEAEVYNVESALQLPFATKFRKAEKDKIVLTNISESLYLRAKKARECVCRK